MVCQNRIYLIKQITATSVSGFLSLCAGLAFGFSAVLLPQLKKDENFPYDESYSSWIASVTPLSMVLGCLSAGSIIDGLGRKPGHIILAFSFTVSWLIQAFAKNNQVMLLGRFFTGICTGAIRPITLVYLGEIADPKYRGLMLFTPPLTLNAGIILNHALGGFVFWRTNSLVCGAPSMISIVLLLILKESPLWLISKGKIEEGVEIFKWFRGETDAAEKELKSILEKQKTKTSNVSMKDYLKKDFLKPLLISFFLAIASQCNGANVITFYAQDILEKLIPHDYDPFTLMITTDCVRLFAALVIFFFGNRFPRKISFLVCIFGASLLLCGLLGLLYSNFTKLKWLSVVLLIAYVALASATVTFAWSFVTELYPSKLRGTGSGVSAGIAYLLLSLMVKVTPGIISAFGVKILFFCFAAIATLNAIALFFLLPETSGRSLQEIEDGYDKKNIIISKL
ncbi:unnamed protein product [Parnassius apollo]|uniref:(apollo) hypothetical protein n=1 Tax=Parnassius apollo TaxID=110799 RepID=A0A8S3XQE3_PARAO|nr:unnamed protein product [Parnassius apollo]